MISVLFGMIAVLAAVVIVQYRAGRMRAMQLAYISKKLGEVLKHGASRKVLLYADDPELQKLLIELNRALDRMAETGGSPEAAYDGLPLAKVNLNRICQTVVRSYRQECARKGLRLTLKLTEQPHYVLGDEDMLERIVHHLLANAVEHGAQGGALGVTLRQEEDDLLLEVWDQGSGIGAQHQKLIFDRPYAAEDAINRSVPGRGVGLAQTRRLIERLGGSVAVRSAPGERTVFTVKLRRLKSIVGELAAKRPRS
ncbi:hypothetical protein IDH44_21330 [Paenibacillus sp. IB182496]|uniref:histidine kinase n=1 Tax=Paenibacillus sabuli TaxID=2772509 RepID=A0A927GTM4_9BACL|nr:ATP-binding protein [Paenibacillus sabuli]MBD2847743.1 hypothetical protein [Paenibacillus sabuli]